MTKPTMKICDHCKQPEPNVGPWEDGRQLCGGCKARITLANPKIRAELERDIRAFALALEQEPGEA